MMELGIPKVTVNRSSVDELGRSTALSFGAGRGSRATGDVALNIVVVSMRVSCLMSSKIGLRSIFAHLH